MAKIGKIKCGWVFKSTECGYPGTENSCDQTFEACKKKGNEARFGGGLSLPHREENMNEKENIITDILQKMAQVCPVSCFVFVSMDSDFPDYITLRWRWKIKERMLRYSIRINHSEIYKSRVDIIQTYILPLKSANWQSENL